MTNPLYTRDQQAAETRALRLVERADVRAAREAARRHILADPVSRTGDGALRLDNALDQWVLALAMREANGDTADPRVVWNVSNPPRHWFGHVYHGAAVAVDNPDNFNREIPIDGSGQYQIDIRFSADPPQFSIVIEMEPALFYQTPHYVGWPSVLVRYDALPEAELAPLLREAWARRVPKGWLKG